MVYKFYYCKKCDIFKEENNEDVKNRNFEHPECEVCGEKMVYTGKREDKDNY